MSKTLKFQILVIHIVVLLTYLGLALPYSIFPMIFISTGQGHGLVTYSFIISTYPIGQTFGMIVFGHLSDLHGRRKILLISLFGAILTFIGSGICISYHYYILLILLRFFCGMFEGNFSIALAAINDLQKQLGSKAKWFGRINIALTTGFLLGPLLGSIFSNPQIIPWFNYSTPFFIAAMLNLATLVTVKFFFIETKNTKLTANNRLSNLQLIGNTFKKAIYYLKKPGVNVLIIISLFVTTSIELLYQFIPVYLVDNLNATSQILSFAVLFLSIGKILGNSYLINVVYDALKSETRCIILGLIGVIICVAILLSITSITLIFIIIVLLGVCISSSITYSLTLISNYISRYSHGSVLSITQSLRILVGAIFCNIAALGCKISFKFPFYCSILLSIIGIYLLFTIFKKKSAKAASLQQV